MPRTKDEPETASPAPESRTAEARETLERLRAEHATLKKTVFDASQAGRLTDALAARRRLDELPLEIELAEGQCHVAHAEALEAQIPAAEAELARTHAVLETALAEYRAAEERFNQARAEYANTNVMLRGLRSDAAAVRREIRPLGVRPGPVVRSAWQG